MTVSSTQSYIEYNADGTTTAFTIPYYFLLNSDISIQVSDASGNVTSLINGSDFTVTGAGNAGGGVATLNTAYASGYLILIQRDPPATQETKYYENGKFPAKSHEAALDKLTMLVQQWSYWWNNLALKRPNFFSKYYDAKSFKISNLNPPVAGNDAANKQYVDDGLTANTSAWQQADVILNNKIDSNFSRTLRVSSGSLSEIPSINSRRNKQVGFDSSGDVALSDPAGTGLWGYEPIDSFEDGNVLTQRFEVLHYKSNGEYYRWDGPLPKIVPAGSTPSSTGGVGIGAWLSVGDATLRPKVMRTVQLEDYGAVGDGVTDDTPAFVAANADLSDDSFISLVQCRNYKITGFTFTKRISIGCTYGRASITSDTGLSWLTDTNDLNLTISNIDIIPTQAPDQNNQTNAIRIEVTNKNLGSAGFAIITGVGVKRPGTLAFYNGISVKNQPVIIEGGDIVLLQSHTNAAAKDGSLANWAVNSGDGILLDSATYSAVRNVKVYYASNAIRATGQIEEVHLMECAAFNNRRCYVFEGLTGSANEQRIWGCHGVSYLEGINLNSDGVSRISLCSVGSSSILAAADATADQIVYLSGWLDGANISSFQAFNNGTRGTNDIAVWLKTVGGVGSRRVFIDGLHARGVGTAIYLDTNERQYINGVSVLQVNMTGSAPVVYAYGPNNTTAPVSNAFGFPEQENVFTTGVMATRFMATGWIGIKAANTVSAAGAERLRIREVSGNFRIESADSTGALQYNAGIDQGGASRTKGVYPLTTNTYTSGSPSFTWSGGYTQVAFTVTSDMREKTDISPLSSEGTLLDAWGDVDWYRFKLIDHVNRFGDAAEYQMGVMAQEILSIFQSHGLDAAEYGIVSYSSWEESTDAESGEVNPAGDLYTVNYEAANALEAVYQRRNYEQLLKRVEALENK